MIILCWWLCGLARYVVKPSGRTSPLSRDGGEQKRGVAARTRSRLPCLRSKHPLVSGWGTDFINGRGPRSPESMNPSSRGQRHRRLVAGSSRRPAAAGAFNACQFSLGRHIEGGCRVCDRWCRRRRRRRRRGAPEAVARVTVEGCNQDPRLE